MKALIDQLGRQLGVLQVELTFQQLRAENAEAEVTRLKGAGIGDGPQP